MSHIVSAGWFTFSMYARTEAVSVPTGLVGNQVDEVLDAEPLADCLEILAQRLLQLAAASTRCAGVRLRRR